MYLIRVPYRVTTTIERGSSVVLVPPHFGTCCHKSESTPNHSRPLPFASQSNHFFAVCLLRHVAKVGASAEEGGVPNFCLL